MSGSGNSMKSVFGPIGVGLGLTFIVVGIFFWLGSKVHCGNDVELLEDCRSNFQWFLTSEPNEIGDALAGFAGSLAFIWIVVTVWMQGAELKLQRFELALQRQEFEKMVEAQTSQAHIMSQQLDVVTREQLQRDEARLDEVSNVMLVDLYEQLFGVSQRIVWSIHGDKETEGDPYLRLFGSLGSEVFDEPRLRRACRNLEQDLKRISDVSTMNILRGLPNDKTPVTDSVEVILRLEKISQKLSEAQRMKIEMLKLAECRTLLQNLCDQEGLWTVAVRRGWWSLGR